MVPHEAPPAIKPISAKKDDSSALTGRSMERIATDRDAVWQSNRAAGPSPATATALEVDTSKLPAAAARFIEPMRAKLTDALPEGDAWDYEIKLDGYRALLIQGKDGIRLLSRNNRTLADRFGEVVKAGSSIARETVLDGEIVALDEEGRLVIQHTAEPPDHDAADCVLRVRHPRVPRQGSARLAVVGSPHSVEQCRGWTR